MQNDAFGLEGNEADLVDKARKGDRPAFETLVRRHQAGVCAIAYSVCGDHTMSEDIAQDSFLAAWEGLAELREGARFRAWVCGISRTLALNHVRRRSRRGDRAVETTTEDSKSDDALPSEEAASSDEKALLWKALNRLPALYREPLVLFYFEQQSVSAVATSLDLSEVVAKKRISRGRALLREEMASQLERVLGATRPGVLFTLAVMGALPPAVGLVVSETGVAEGAGLASKGLLKSPALTGGLIKGLLGTCISAGMGLLGLYVAISVWRSPWLSRQSRKLLLGLGAASFSTTSVYAGFLYYEVLRLTHGTPSSGASPAAMIHGATAAFFALNFVFAVLTFRAMVQARKSLLAATKVASTLGPRDRSQRYTSRLRLFGMPLVSIAHGPDAHTGESYGTARGWVAIGDLALGGFVAVGSVAVGPLSCGAFAIGIVALGGGALGVLGIGAWTIAWLSCGTFALGWLVAVGGVAVGHHGAIGMVSLANYWALGPAPFAAATQYGDVVAALKAQAIPALILQMLPYLGWVALLGLPSCLYALALLRKARRAR